MSNVYKSEEVKHDNLLLTGQANVVTDVVVIAENQELKRGSVIGLKTDTQQAYLVDKTKTDGTEKPYAVLAEDADTTGKSFAVAAVYFMAELNADELIVGSGEISDYKQDLRKIGLFVRDVQNRGI